MGVIAIVRDWGTNPAIVRMETTDTIAAASATGYLTAQAANIDMVNSGPFEFLANDLIAVAASDGDALFQFVGGVFATLVPFVTQSFLEVPITLAHFIAMYDAPVLLVPAPGVGGQLVFNKLQVVQTYGSAALANGGTSAVQYDSTVHGAGVIASTTLANTVLQATASTTYTYNAGVVALPFSTTVNKGLYLSCLSGDFTAGTGSTFVAKVWYSLIQTV